MTDETVKPLNQQPTIKPYSVIKRKERIQRPKLLDEIFHQTRQKRSVYYLTSGRKINNKQLQAVKMLEHDNPFELPPVENLLKRRAIDKEINDEERKADRRRKVHDKHTYRSRQMLNINERLLVPSDDKLTEGIVDIDKQFFTIVKGRPLKEKRFDLRNYVQNIKEGFRSRLKAGYIYDEIYLIERQQYTETKIIEGIRQKLQEYTNSFDEFLAKDNDRSMALLRQASEEANKTNEKREELAVTLEKFVKLKCEMYRLEEIWDKGNACKNFLYDISPQLWKKKYEKSLAKHVKDKGDDDVIDLTESLESLLEPFMKDTAKECPPLYFTKPWQLRYIFRDMELKNQNSLLFLEYLRKPNEIAEACLKITQDYYTKEISKIEENLSEIEKFILIEENRAIVLKETTKKFINTVYKNAISGEKSVLLHAHVQNAYEACITSDGNKLSVVEMLKDLEIEYKRLLLELDSLPIECVREAKSFVKKDTALIFGQAKEARAQINYLDILLRRVISAVDPPVQKTTRSLVFRSEPPPPLPKVPPPPKELTLEELEHIYYFTDKKQDDILNEFKLYYPLGY